MVAWFSTPGRVVVPAPSAKKFERTAAQSSGLAAVVADVDVEEVDEPAEAGKDAGRACLAASAMGWRSSSGAPMVMIST